jgi:hypothetical protein
VLAGLAHADDLPVVVKRRPSARIASLGAVTAGYDDVALAEAELLGRVPAPARGGLRGVLWHQCADAGVPCGEPFVELRAPRPSNSRLDVKELPAATVACAYAPDDHDAAELAYDAIRAWMERQCYALAGPKRELYHGGMLEVQFPIG